MLDVYFALAALAINITHPCPRCTPYSDTLSFVDQPASNTKSPMSNRSNVDPNVEKYPHPHIRLGLSSNSTRETTPLQTSGRANSHRRSAHLPLGGGRSGFHFGRPGRGLSGIHSPHIWNSILESETARVHPHRCPL